MLKDIEYFNTKLGKIDGFGDLGNHLTELANAKQSPDNPTEQTEQTGET